jgi:hypothetical protein
VDGPLDFENCYSAIEIHWMNAEITNNQIINSLVGINISKCKNREVYIMNNTIESSKYGISLQDNFPANSMIITGNQITNEENQMYSYTAYNPACINIEEYMSSLPQNNYIVSDNYLIVNDLMKYGINNNCGSGIQISENTIELNDPVNNIAGIEIKNCDENKLYCNHIYGTRADLGNSTELTPFAIRVVTSDDYNIYFNYMYDTYTGMGFEQTCLSENNIHHNHFHGHSYGLHYSANAQTDLQYNCANEWHNTCCILKAKNENSNPSLSEYTIGTGCSNCLPATGEVDPPSWFIYDSQLQTQPATPPCQNQGMPAILPDSTLYTFDYTIAVNSQQYQIFAEEREWADARQLFDKLESNLELLSTNPVIEEFYDSTQNASPGIFQSMQILTNEAYSGNNNQKLTLDSLRNIASGILSSLHEIDSLLGTHPLHADSLVYLGERVELAHTLKQVNYQINTILGVGYNNLKLALTALQVENIDLPANSLFEVNEKIINDIRFNYVINGSKEFSPEQKAEILEVASQCPVSGGKIVYIARAMLSSFMDTAFNDTESCLLSWQIKSMNQATQQKSVPDPRFYFYPNPASNQEIKLCWDLPSEENCMLQVFNSLGQVVYLQEVSLKSQSIQMAISGLPAGSYVLRVSNDRFQKSLGPLMIMKD